jgi:ribosomal protein L7Ae-like RNA K-turn-binding protein
MADEKIYSFLGLAKKAGKVFTGDDTCERLIKTQKACVTVIAQDASPNTVKKFTDKCKSRDVPLKIFGTKELLGRFTGKEIRAVLVITDNGFAKRIIEMIEEYNISGGDING